MKQFAIYFEGTFILGHIIAYTKESAIAKFRDNNEWIAKSRLTAELVEKYVGNNTVSYISAE